MQRVEQRSLNTWCQRAKATDSAEERRRGGRRQGGVGGDAFYGRSVTEG